MGKKTFKVGQLITCDQLDGYWSYNPETFDKDGYVEIKGFGKVHINNFTARPLEPFTDKAGNKIGISPVTSARENFTKRLEDSWGKIPVIPSNAKIEFHSITPFQELVDKNYQSVVDRGLINEHTDFYDFMEKLEEESQEMAAEYIYPDFEDDTNKKERFASELIDCISVLLNMAKHYNIDVIEGLKANITKNQERAKANQ